MATARVGADWRPRPDTDQILAVDTLVLAFGLLPDDRLARLAGCDLRRIFTSWSQEVWPLAAVEPHWDRLELRAWSTDAHGRRLYQEGLLAALLTPAQLLRRSNAPASPPRAPSSSAAR